MKFALGKKLPLGAGGSWPGSAGSGLGKPCLAPRSRCPQTACSKSSLSDGTWWDETLQPLWPGCPSLPARSTAGEAEAALGAPRSQAGPGSPGLAFPQPPGVSRGGSETERWSEGLNKLPGASLLPMPYPVLGEAHPALLWPSPGSRCKADGGCEPWAVRAVVTSWGGGWE